MLDDKVSTTPRGFDEALTLDGVADLRYERLNMPVIETSIHKASGC
jgi:hypothetical protein